MNYQYYVEFIYSFLCRLYFTRMSTDLTAGCHGVTDGGSSSFHLWTSQKYPANVGKGCWTTYTFCFDSVDVPLMFLSIYPQNKAVRLASIPIFIGEMD